MKQHEWKLWLILAVFFALPAAACLTWDAIYFGAVFLGALAIGCAGECIVVRHQNKSRICAYVARLGRILFVCFLISFVWIQWLILSGEYKDAGADTAERVLVLGARIYPDRPSESLKSRLDTAVALANENPDAVFIVCGGQGSDEVMPESHMMQSYLIEQGVESSRILVEDTSHNTIENIENAKNLYQLETYETAVITSEFHLARTRRLMEQAGLQPNGIPAPTPYLSLRIVSHLREYCSTLGLILTGRYF